MSDQTVPAVDNAPTRVVVCGSLAHPDLIAAAVAAERAAGREVIAYPEEGVIVWADDMAQIWRRYIDEADEVLVVRKPGGTIGDAVHTEWLYAVDKGKPFRFFPTFEEVPQSAAGTGMSVDEARVAAALRAAADAGYVLIRPDELDKLRARLVELKAMEQRAREVATGQAFLAEVDMRSVARHVLGEGAA